MSNAVINPGAKVRASRALIPLLLVFCVSAAAFNPTSAQGMHANVFSGGLEVDSLHRARELLTGAVTDPSFNSPFASLAVGAPNPNLNLTQLTLNARILSVISQAIGLPSGILQLVYGAIQTVSGAIGIPLSEYSKDTDRVNWFISAYAFDQTLYNDFNKAIDGSDYLGDAAKYVKLWNMLNAQIGSSSVSQAFTDNMSQLTQAKALLDILSSGSSGSS